MIINFGSINIDHVYRVQRIPEPGETLSIDSYAKFPGGKGANQSVAIVKSGGRVRHVGAVGSDGAWVLERLKAMGLALDHVCEVDKPTGHAVIMVDRAGNNRILICNGANHGLASEQIVRELDRQDGKGHWVLLQNETNMVSEIVGEAKSRGYMVAYNAAPFVAAQMVPLLGDIDLLAVNEVEARTLADWYRVSVERIPVRQLLVTRGASGATFHRGGKTVKRTAFRVTPMDTTGAGDTFLGAFLAHHAEGAKLVDSLRFAAAASAIQITRHGAAEAIPDKAEVDRFLEERKTR